MTITPELKPDLISPKLFTEFQQLNEEQRRIVLHDQGPMMVIAGPGSGKTRCLTPRAMNLLLLKKASPQEMVLCTYTEKAAFEMQDRLSTIARRVGYSEDIAQIRIGTIHGICNRIIMENLHRIPATDQQTPPLGNNYEMIVGPYNLSSARAGKSLGFTKTNKLLYDFLDNWFVASGSLAEEGLKLMGKKHPNDSSRSGTAGGSSGRGDRDHSPREQDAGAPNPSDLLPSLDERQLSVLHLVGREWDRVSGDPAVWREALPVDPALGSYPAPTEIRPTRFGRFVRVSLQRGQLPAVEATSAAEVPPSLLSRLGYDLRRIVLGAPLRSTAIAHERMRKLVALPVLSAEALSSVAYGPEAMLAILVLGGSAALGYAVPIAAVIAFLMLAVGVSYRQTIRAYPHGGGSYIVASDNLGRVPGLVARRSTTW